MSKTKLVLVDDHKILLDGLEALLVSTNDNYDISKEESGEAFLGRADLEKIDIAIFDINMKEKDGITTYKEAMKNGFKGKCLFLSSYDDLKLINEAINLGANGYITKSSATDNLSEAIELAMKNEIYYSPDIRTRILKSFANGGKKQRQDSSEKGIIRQLTDREMDVLLLIAQEFTSDQIAKKLYIAKSTVDTHRKNLIHKLKVKNAVGLGLFAERNGLL
jgi:DNA-binding NarL/FixJ family response regulator